MGSLLLQQVEERKSYADHSGVVRAECSCQDSGGAPAASDSILNDIPPQAVADYSEMWTDEDVEDFRNASAAYMLGRLEEEAGEVNA